MANGSNVNVNGGNDKKFTKVDNEILKSAIIAKYNEEFRKDDTPLKDVTYNQLLKLDVKGLKEKVFSLVTSEKLNPAKFKVTKMSIEVGEELNNFFDVSNIELDSNGKKEQLAKKVIVMINSVYKNTVKDTATAKQVTMVQVIDLLNVKGLEIPNLKNLDTTIRVSKAKISDLSDTAVNKIDELLEVA